MPRGAKLEAKLASDVSRQVLVVDCEKVQNDTIILPIQLPRTGNLSPSSLGQPSHTPATPPPSTPKRDPQVFVVELPLPLSLHLQATVPLN